MKISGYEVATSASRGTLAVILRKTAEKIMNLIASFVILFFALLNGVASKKGSEKNREGVALILFIIVSLYFIFTFYYNYEICPK